MIFLKALPCGFSVFHCVTAQNLKEMELVAGALAVRLQYLDVLAPKDIETKYAVFTQNGSARGHLCDKILRC